VNATQIQSRTAPIVIAGATSTLGATLAKRTDHRHWVPVCNRHIQAEACRDWRRLNVEDIDGWKRLIDEVQPAYWIHAAGFCNVGQCEANPPWARAMNVEAVRDMLDFLPGAVRLVYLSSDHVFGGRDVSYLESDTPDPVSTYGRLRVEAEEMVLSARPDALVLRPGLCLGPSIDGRRGHWDNLPRRLREGLSVTIIEGEFRSAFWAEDAAERLVELMESDAAGVWHLWAESCVGRVVLAKAICRAAGWPCDVTVQHVDDLPEPHLRRVMLKTHHAGPLAKPLPSILDRLALNR